MRTPAGDIKRISRILPQRDPEIVFAPGVPDESERILLPRRLPIANSLERKRVFDFHRNVQLSQSGKNPEAVYQLIGEMMGSNETINNWQQLAEMLIHQKDQPK